jgi:hypothetical protein
MGSLWLKAEHQAGRQLPGSRVMLATRYSASPTYLFGHRLYSDMAGERAMRVPQVRGLPVAR